MTALQTVWPAFVPRVKASAPWTWIPHHGMGGSTIRNWRGCTVRKEHLLMTGVMHVRSHDGSNNYTQSSIHSFSIQFSITSKLVTIRPDLGPEIQKHCLEILVEPVIEPIIEMFVAITPCKTNEVLQLFLECFCILAKVLLHESRQIEYVMCLSEVY